MPPGDERTEAMHKAMVFRNAAEIHELLGGKRGAPDHDGVEHERHAQQLPRIRRRIRSASLLLARLYCVIVEPAGIIWAARCLSQIERLSQSIAVPRERPYDGT